MDEILLEDRLKSRLLMFMLEEIDENESGKYISLEYSVYGLNAHLVGELITLIINMRLATTPLKNYDYRKTFIQPTFGSLTDMGKEKFDKLRKDFAKQK